VLEALASGKMLCKGVTGCQVAGYGEVDWGRLMTCWSVA
jgi:hypothetical protein